MNVRNFNVVDYYNIFLPAAPILHTNVSFHGVKIDWTHSFQSANHKLYHAAISRKRRRHYIKLRFRSKVSRYPRILLCKKKLQKIKITSTYVISTTLQSLMNTRLSLHRFWPCYENGLIKTIHTIPHNLYVNFKLTSLYSGLRIILVYPNPQ